jgi:glyoxylase-like metal-dependent hydrolase (beta-lactamase superfamily II)
MDDNTFRFSVGSFRCIAVSDGSFAYPIGAFTENVPVEQVVEELRDQGRPTDHVVTPYTCLVVDTGNHRVLVDTGMGPLPPGFPSTTGRLFDNLRAAGIEPDAIDTVVLTHGHADHIGGNVIQGVPAFPRARYVMNRSEWEFWASAPTLNELRIADEIKGFLRAWAETNLLPLRELFDLIEGDQEIVPGIRAIAAPGHTPGHTALAIESDGELVLDLVDTVLDPLQLVHPDWVAEFDFDPGQTITTRRRLFDRAADERARVLCYHFPFPGLGRVTKADSGWRWEPATEG